MGFSYVHIRYFKGYLHHICLQDTISLHSLLCLLCQALLLPRPLRPLLRTPWSGFSVSFRVATNALFMAFPVVHDVCYVCYVKGR